VAVPFWLLVLFSLGEASRLVLGRKDKHTSAPTLKILKRIAWDLAAGLTIAALAIQILWEKLSSVSLHYKPYTTGTRYIHLVEGDAALITWGLMLLLASVSAAAAIRLVISSYRQVAPSEEDRK